MTEDAPRLQKSQVKYLAVEGGGGKGNALPGAIQALEYLGILQVANFKPTGVLGYAGSSAGAINALFLSCGYDYDEIKFILDNQDFNEFFDAPEFGRVPRIFGCRTATEAYATTSGDDIFLDLLEEMAIAIAKSQPLGLLTIGPTSLGKSLVRIFKLSLDLADKYAMVQAGIVMFFLVSMIAEGLPDSVRQTLTNHATDIAKCIRYEYGIFPGCTIRSFFDKWLSIARYRVQANNLSNCLADQARLGKSGLLKKLSQQYDAGGMDEFAHARFEDHARDFGVKLAVTGSNLETYKSHVFSADTTPRMVVSDAVRISMSLPIAFKPVIIEADSDDLRQVIDMANGESTSQTSPDTGESEPHYLAGLWVDGGLCNNFPIDAFDDEPGSNPKTLGLRLGLDERQSITSIMDYLVAWPMGFSMNAGETHISQTSNNWHQTIILDPVELGTFDFAPDADKMKAAQDKAWDSVFAYFGYASPRRE